MSSIATAALSPWKNLTFPTICIYVTESKEAIVVRWSEFPDNAPDKSFLKT